MTTLDFSLFNFINQDLANSVLDYLAPVLRERNTWIPLYIVLFIVLIYKFRKNCWLIILGAILAVGIADYSSSSIIKPIVKRERPCREPLLKDKVRLLVNCGAAYSFPSSHAANHFALAAFLGFTIFSKRRVITGFLYLWACSIAFSQVYVGVHYPADVTAGALWGITIAWIIFTVFNRIKPQLVSLYL